MKISARDVVFGALLSFILSLYLGWISFMVVVALFVVSDKLTSMIENVTKKGDNK